MLSHRESIKISSTAIYAIVKIENNFNSGQKLRDDGFFKEDRYGRSNADEIVEGILFSAQREHEEKKLKYYGNLLANIAFDDTITKEQANQLISLSKNMSYRQIKLLKIFNINERVEGKCLLRNDAYIKSNSDIDTNELASILQDILNLCYTAIIGVENPGVMLIVNPESIIPSEMRLKRIGKLLYKLMELDDIPEDELKELIAMLK